MHTKFNNYLNMHTKFNIDKPLFQRELGLYLTMRMHRSRGQAARRRVTEINQRMDGIKNIDENKYLKQLDGTFIEFYRTKPPEAIFEIDDWTRCCFQTNKDAKSTYDQLTIELLCKSELKDIKGYPVSFTKDGNVSLNKLLPDCVTYETILTQYMLCNFEHNHLQKYNDKKIQKFDSEHRVINEIQIFAGKHAYSHSEIRISFRPIELLVLLHSVTKKISLVVKNSYDYRTEKFTMFAN